MKRIALMVYSLLFTVNAHAVLQGKLDLPQPPTGLYFRDLRNGQNLAGEAKHLWHLELNGHELFHLALNHTTNAEGQNQSAGLGLGVHLSLNQIGDIAKSIQDSNAKSPRYLGYIGDIVSVQGGGGWMPIHTGDVKGPWIYGYGFELDVLNILSVIQKGLW